MEDNVCEEFAIKINWRNDVYYDNGIAKFKDTNLPLDGIYEDEKGAIHYFKNGKRHNENGAAYITKEGHKEYYINGKIHRIDGPAVIWSNGYYNWYINDHKIDKETVENWLIENDIPLDCNVWSNKDKMLFALYWSDYNE